MSTVQRHPTSLAAIAASVAKHHVLIGQLTRRDIVGRYRGSFLGLAWSFVGPLIMLGIYTFVFSVIFRTRWGGAAQDSRASLAVMLFTGLIVHGFVAECVNRAPGLILANVNLVKKVVFPLEILPWTILGSALFHAAASLAVLLVAQVVMTGGLPWTIVWLPFVALPLVLGTAGAAWGLSALGVYVRDIGQVTGMIMTMLLFLSPVFYPASSLPEAFRPWLYANPLTPIIEDARGVAILGEPVVWGRWLIVLAVSVVFAQAGFWFFQRTRRGFPDVL